MTAKEFVAWAEAYYGEYRPVVKIELIDWLEERGHPFIEGLRERVREEFSNQFRIPPDIAALSKFREQETYDRGYDVIEMANTKRIAATGSLEKASG